MGVVKTVRENLSPLHEIFVCEMGARRVGEIKELCDLVHPRYGIITSVGPQHLETFLTQERVRKTKFELAKALPEEGFVCLNADSEELMKEDYKGRQVLYSLEGAWQGRLPCGKCVGFLGRNLLYAGAQRRACGFCHAGYRTAQCAEYRGRTGYGS